MALKDDEFEGALSDPDQNAFVAAAKDKLAAALDKLPQVADEVDQIHRAGDCAEAAEKLISYARNVKFLLNVYEDHYKAVE